MTPWTLSPVFVVRHAGFPFDWLEELGLSAAVLDAADAVLDAETAKAPPERLEVLRTAFAQLHDLERGGLRARLKHHAADVGVQEAVFLSSPATFDNTWRSYLAADVSRDDSSSRRTERTVYTYLQRLCAKNETVSFFGPMGYAHVVEEAGLGLRAVPGAPQRRRTFFSFWAVTELSRALARDLELLPDLPIRRSALFDFEPTTVSGAPLGTAFPLDPASTALLQAIAPVGTLRDAATRATLPLRDALRALSPLLKAGALLLGVPLEAADFNVFEQLLHGVQALRESPARDRWEARLRELGALLAAFSAGTFEERRTRMAPLEARFEAVTGQPARRGAGEIYSDRHIFYEEASSPFDFQVGRAFLEELSLAATPALELSAAYGAQVQRRYQDEISPRLAEAGGTLDFVSYALRMRPETVEQNTYAARPPMDLAALQPGADGALPPAPAGPRYALPDLCLGAKEGAVTPGGGFTLVVSRVHHHLLVWNWLCAFYADRPAYDRVAQGFIERMEQGEPLVALAVARRNKGFYSFPGRRVLYNPGDDAGDGRALRGADLQVTLRAGVPVLEDAGGRRHHLYLTLDDLTRYAPLAALAHPLVLHPPLRDAGSATVPRVMVGDAVYQRQQWELAAEGLGKKRGSALLLQVRKEARAHGLPRFVFARSDRERKPYFIDLHCPFALEVLRHLCHGALRVTFTEMLPGPEALWLRDARGRYTCELRVQALREDPA